MKVRKVWAEDLPQANHWRRQRGVPELQADALPETGCVASEGGQTLAMVWLYISNSKLAYLAWPVTRPGISPRKASQALKACFQQLISLARALGMRYLVSTSSSRGLTRLLVKSGFETENLPHDYLTMEVI